MVYASGAKQERMDVTWSGKKEETPGLKTFFFDEAVLVLWIGFLDRFVSAFLFYFVLDDADSKNLILSVSCMHISPLLLSI